MSVKLKIKVTRNEINKGVCTDPRRCAVALAVGEIFPNVAIHSEKILFNNSSSIIPLPSHVTSFINSFDKFYKRESNRDVLPEIEFEVDVPEEVLCQATESSLEDVKEIISKSRTLELV